VNRDLVATPPHPSKRISDAVAANPDVVNLTVGEPSFGAPAAFLDRLSALVADGRGDPAGEYNRYAHSRGVAALRRAIAASYRSRYGLAVDPDTQLLVTHGAAEAIWLTVFTLTNPGDEVLMTDPCYMLYEPITVSLGRRPVRLRTSAGGGFRLSPEQVEEAAGDRARLLLLNSPNNPTGCVYDAGTLAALHAVAAARELTVMHDEVFDDYSYAGAHVPALAMDPQAERTVMVNSFSKRYGMTGWRLGWMLAAPAVVAEATKAHTYLSLSLGTAIQEAAAGIVGDEAVEREVRAHAEVMRERGRGFLDRLREIAGFGSVPAEPPGGGFYLFVPIGELAGRLGLDREPGSISIAVADLLLRTAGVAVVPGNGFGPGGEGYVRMSYAAPQERLDLALDRLRRCLEPTVGAH
jgi:aspartate/methionine/tyrosine aminotransferase